jgi:hypothetical protein
MATENLPRQRRPNYCKSTTKEASCEECKIRFLSIRKGHRFCSWFCSRAYIKRTQPFVPKEISCQQCKRKFPRKTVWQNFCSASCRNRWHKNPTARSGSKKCEICASLFIPKKTWNQVYCSEKCHMVGLSKATGRYRIRNKKIGLCLNCPKKTLPTSSLCEEHWYKRAARTNGFKKEDGWKLIKKLLKDQNFMCPYSGRELVLGFNASMDHINPKSRFPEQAHLLENLEWIDIEVNSAKRDLTKEEYVSLCKLVASRFK